MSTTTAVEELREAARKLEDLAEPCEQGPWTVESDGKGNAWINLPAYPHAWGMHGFPEEAYYVASMHPGVALALARVMEQVAWCIDLDEHLIGRIGYEELLETARAINGGPR